MAEYMFIVRGPAGCDYSIGCGVVVCDVEADDDAEAVALGTKKLEAHGAHFGEGTVSAVRLVRMGPDATVRFDLDLMRKVSHEQEVAFAAAAREEADRATYERLRQKFGA